MRCALPAALHTGAEFSPVPGSPEASGLLFPLSRKMEPLSPGVLRLPHPVFQRKAYISSNASSPFFTVSCESPCFTNCIVTKEAAVKAAA